MGGSKNICLHTTLYSNSKWPQEVLQVTCLPIKSPAWHKRALIHMLELVVPQQKPEGLSVPIRPLSSCRHSDVNCRMNSLLQRERWRAISIKNSLQTPGIVEYMCICALVCVCVCESEIDRAHPAGIRLMRLSQGR